MKKMLFVFSFLLPVMMYAQKDVDMPFTLKRSNPVAENIIHEQVRIKNVTAKPTNSGQRLINVVYKESGILRDSIAFTWSGNRGTEHANDPEDLTYFSWNIAPLAVQKFQLPQFLRTPLQKYDSATRYIGSGTGYISYAVANSYNNSDNLTQFDCYNRDGSAPYYITMNYDSSDKVIDARYYIDTTANQSGNYIHRATLKCMYNNSGKLVKDVIVDTAAGFFGWYDYFQDALGKDTAIWVHSIDPTGDTSLYVTRYVLAYNANGLLQTCKFYDWQNVLHEIDSFAYDGVHPYPVFNQFSNDYINNNVMTVSDRKIITLNSTGDIQTFLNLQYNINMNGLDSFYRYTATYNSFDNPDVVYYDYYSGYSWSNPQEAYYHYQTLTDISEIKQQTTLQIYPNPATSKATLQTNNNEPATISITDMQGRLVQRYSVKGRSIQLDLKNLPAGTYIVKYETVTTVGTAKVQKQ